MHPFIMLLWKEWREQQWKLAALTAIAVAVILFVWWREPEVALPMTWTIMAAIATLGAVFIGMGVAAGERSAGTEAMWRGLPVDARLALEAKLLLAAATAAMPVIVAGLISAACLEIIDSTSPDLYRRIDEKELSPWLMIAIFGWGAVSVMLWTTATGARARTELGAGLWGAVTVASWAAVFVTTSLLERLWTDYPIPPGEEPLSLMLWVLMLSPAGLAAPALAPPPVAPSYATVLLLQGLMTVILVSMAMVRSQSVAASAPFPDAGHPDQRRTMAQSPSPRRSRWSALVWLQWREAMPMLAIGLLVIGVVSLFEGLQPVHDYETGDSLLLLDEARAARTMRNAALGWGLLLAMIVGVGTFALDLRPGLAHFWRSRPLAVSTWFWTKWVAGAAALLVVLHGTVLLAHAMFAAGERPLGAGYFGTVPLIHLGVFSAAVLMACAVRQPVYAGILGFGLGIAPFLILETEPRLSWMSLTEVLGDPSKDNFVGWTDPAYLAFAGLWIALAAGMTVWARWAAQR